MKEFDFVRLSGEAENLLKQGESLLVGLDASPALRNQLRVARERLSSGDPVRMVLFGAYNAGKSSLVKALTGDETIVVDANVATSRVQEYSWRSCLIADTPGIRSGTEGDSRAELHDRLTEGYLQKADLVLFVVSNEQFTPRLIETLAKLYRDHRLSGRLMLVINKIDREASDLADVESSLNAQLAEHGIDYTRLFPTLVSARTYLDSVQTTDLEEKATLERESRLAHLIENLNAFAAMYGWSGRIISPVTTAEQVLNRALIERADLTNRRQRERQSHIEAIGILYSAGHRFESACSRLARDFRKKVRLAADETIGSLDFAHLDQEDVQRRMDAAFADLGADVSELEERVSEELEKVRLWLSEQEQAHSEEFQGVGLDDGRAGGAGVVNDPRSKHGDLNYALGGAATQALGKVVTRDAVYAIGKALGFKFKPWGAVNAAANLQKALTVLGVLMELLAGFMAEQQQKKRDQAILELKGILRRAFQEYGAGIESGLQQCASDFRLNCLQPHIDARQILVDELTAGQEASPAEASVRELLVSLELLLTEINAAKEEAVA